MTKTKAESRKQKVEIANRIAALGFACLLCLLPLCCQSCQHRLEPGGAYNPVTTNATTGASQEHPDLALYLADETWRTSYSLALLVCNLERDNRELIKSVGGMGVKHALDSVRPKIAEIDLRWAKARQAYKATPTPENLASLQGILEELDWILTVVQAQRPAMAKALAAAKPK